MFKILKALTFTKWVNKRNNCLYIQSYHLPHFGICKHHIKPYHIKHQHKETASHSNTALQIAIGCKQDTNTQHLHDEIKILPMHTHLKLHATQLKQLTQTQTHPLHDLNAYSDLPRNMKTTIFHNNKHTNITISKLDITPKECRKNLKHIHITIISQHLVLEKKKVTNTTFYDFY